MSTFRLFLSIINNFNNSEINFFVPFGPYISSVLFFCLEFIVCNNPGNPRTWSPCQWVIKILFIFCGETLAIINCLCVPSPQSTNMFCPSSCKSIETAFLFGVGVIEVVPRKVSLIISRKKEKIFK